VDLWITSTLSTERRLLADIRHQTGSTWVHDESRCCWRSDPLSALDVQREYLARAKDFTDSRGADAVSRRVRGLWERVLDAIGAGNLDAIAREIDWVIKYQLIERYQAEHDVPLSAPEVAQADLAYHDIRRDRGLYYQLQRSGTVQRTARDIDIFEAKTVRPGPEPLPAGGLIPYRTGTAAIRCWWP
jgi:Pup-ligase protein